MRPPKLLLTLLVVAIAALACWLWRSRDVGKLATARPQAVSNAADSHVALDKPRALDGIDSTRRDVPDVTDSHGPPLPAPVRFSRSDITVRGHVFAQGSKFPIANAEIALNEHGDDPFARTTSDERGAFELSLAGGAPRRFELLATHEDYSPTWLDAISGDGGDAQLEVELDTHFFISVDVSAPAGRMPVEGAGVRLSSTNPAFVDETLDGLSDALGQFEFEVSGLPRTALQLFVDAYGCAPWLMRELALEPGVRRRNVICNLDEPRKVRGRVIDARNQRAIADAELEIVSNREEFGGAGEEALSDELGVFEIELADCPLEVASLYVRAAGFRAARVDRLEQYAHSHAAELVVELTAPVHLRGNLRASDGQPLREAAIAVAASGLWMDAGDGINVGADGSFDLPLVQVPPGAVRVFCDAEDCVRKTFELVALDCAELLEITLERGVSVHGHVTRASDGAAFPGTRVRLLDASGEIHVSNAGTDGYFRFWIAANAVNGAYLTVELNGQSLARAEIASSDGTTDIVRDISVELAPGLNSRRENR